MLVVSRLSVYFFVVNIISILRYNIFINIK